MMPSSAAMGASCSSCGLLNARNAVNASEQQPVGTKRVVKHHVFVSQPSKMMDYFSKGERDPQLGYVRSWSA